MTKTTAEARPYDPASISDLSFWSATAEEREVTFKELRDHRPLSWHRPLEGSLMMPDVPGIWLVTRYEDVVAVSRDWETFSSAQGVMAESIPQEFIEISSSFLATDPPRHTHLRRLVSSAFTPKQIAKISARIEQRATQIVDELLEVGDCDFVDQVSTRLPMWTIYELLGLPEERREVGARAANATVSWADEDVAQGREPGQVIAEGLETQLGLAHELIAERRAKPEDDLMTALVQAEVEGARLTDQEIAAFMNMLAVAGNDTSRHTTSFAMKALCDFPDQRAILTKDLDNNITTAVEEFIRWATPVQTFRRTVTRETELHGQTLSLVLALRGGPTRQPGDGHSASRGEENLNRSDRPGAQLIERRRIVRQQFLRSAVGVDGAAQNVLGVRAILAAGVRPCADVVTSRIVDHLVDRDRLPIGEPVLERVQLPERHGGGANERDVRGLRALLRGRIYLPDRR